MDDIKNRVIEAISGIENTCSLLYQYKLDEGSAGIWDTLGGIIAAIDAVNSYNKDGMRAQYDMLGLNRCLVEAEKALEMQDFVLFADILCFDIRSILLGLLEG